MGLDDREYVRHEQPRFSLGGDRSMVTNLILVNVAVFVADLLCDHKISDVLALRASAIFQPWNLWQLLTYGFVHDPSTIWHVAFNMFGLWLFGRDMEGIYGRKEFLRLYLSLIVLSGLVWMLIQNVSGGSDHKLIGASGGVFGIMVLYVLHYPRREFLVWGILPVPVWVLCLLYLAQNLVGFLQDGSGGTAYEAHLAGAGFAYLYRRTGWNLGRMLPNVNWRLWKMKLPGGPRLRIHNEPHADEPAGSLQDRLDSILDKITREGKDSLSREEQRFLEDASRRYQKRRQ